MISISIVNDPDHLAWIILFAETAEKKEGGVNVRPPIHPVARTTGPNRGWTTLLTMMVLQSCPQEKSETTLG